MVTLPRIYGGFEVIQLSIFDIVKEKPQCFEDYIGRCDFCHWGDDKYTCQWSEENPSRNKYGGCRNGSRWMPGELKIPKLCGNCKCANDFHYQGDDIYHPIEEPDIYCTRKEGSINRQQPFKRFYSDGFGVGTWHRQHEWDTCEGWELYNYWGNLKDGKIERRKNDENRTNRR